MQFYAIRDTNILGKCYCSCHLNITSYDLKFSVIVTFFRLASIK